MSSKGRILVAMSGGVDSSVSAVMLKEQGYDVIGITMKTWDYSRVEGKSDKETGCCTLESMNDARQIAVRHGFKHFIVDIRDEFGDWVIDRFVEDYMSGRTPNPCVLCNTHIKWAALLRRADKLGCDYIATGHYARVREENGRYVVSRGLDPRKDQSYALWGVHQKHLARTIFPWVPMRRPKSAIWPKSSASPRWLTSLTPRDLLRAGRRLPALPEGPCGWPRGARVRRQVRGPGGQHRGRARGLSLLYHRPAEGTRPGPGQEGVRDGH
ncbi:MAG: hypothetical protein U5K31_05250 [Balneolaceae bacterium]|nr:hypothetical protein [Balneolaceae bacterium]